MKDEKWFYILHLDSKRLGVLFAFLLGIIGSFFFFGVSVGKTQTKQMLAQDDTLPQEPQTIQLSNQGPQDGIPESQVPYNPTPSNPVEAPSVVEKESVVDLTPPRDSEISIKKSVDKSPKKKEEASVSKKSDLKPSALPKETDQIISKKPQNTVSQETNKKQSDLYVVQLGAFSDKKKADDFLKSVNDQFKGKLLSTAYIVESNGIYQVRVGKGKDKKKAEGLLTRVHSFGEITKSAVLAKP
jgi:cell division septation protein DedD